MCVANALDRKVLIFCTNPGLEAEMRDGLTRSQIPSTACPEILRDPATLLSGLRVTMHPKIHLSSPSRNRWNMSMSVNLFWAEALLPEVQTPLWLPCSCVVVIDSPETCSETTLLLRQAQILTLDFWHQDSGRKNCVHPALCSSLKKKKKTRWDCYRVNPLFKKTSTLRIFRLLNSILENQLRGATKMSSRRASDDIYTSPTNSSCSENPIVVSKFRPLLPVLGDVWQIFLFAELTFHL